MDPPRSGLDDTMKETILKSKIKTMIYVSCNPATLAKDLGVLKKEYRIVKIQPVDMFSQTPHVESVTLLVRNDDYRPRRRFDDRKGLDYKPRRDGNFKPRRRFDDKKMAITNQDAVLRMINQEEEMVTLSLDVVLMRISLDADSMMMISLDVDLMIEKMVTINQEDVLMMINQIVDMVNKNMGFQAYELKSFSYLRIIKLVKGKEIYD